MNVKLVELERVLLEAELSDDELVIVFKDKSTNGKTSLPINYILSDIIPIMDSVKILNFKQVSIQGPDWIIIRNLLRTTDFLSLIVQLKILKEVTKNEN